MKKKKAIKIITKILIAFVLFATPFAVAGCSFSSVVWKSGTDCTVEFKDAKVGDYFIDTNDYVLYQKTSAGWTVIMKDFGKPGNSPSAPVVTISKSGYWEINGKNTGKIAVATDGQTPYIHESGYWYIGDENLGVLAQGSPGDTGKSAFELYKEANTDFKGTLEDWFNLLKGKDGATWLTGTLLSGKSTTIYKIISGAKQGDLYFNTNTCDIYKCTTTNYWQWISNIRGTDGQNGQDGVDAEQIDYMALYNTCKENGDIPEDTTFIQFIQIVCSGNGQESVLLSVQHSIRSSVSIFNIGKSSSSAGSGSFFRIDDDGTAYIVTNFHVTYSEQMPETYYILLYEDNYLIDPSATGISTYIKQYAIPATYVGGSKEHDIAVLKISANSKIKEYKEKGIITAVNIAQDIANNTEDLAVGSACYAVGNAMGEGISATQGIISVASENITLDDVTSTLAKIKMRLIRTTCLINGGNSGGGLFNLKGELIGVMNSKRIYASTTNSNEVHGVTYAIPASVVLNVYNKIMSECNGTTITTPNFKKLGIETTIIDSSSAYNINTGILEVRETIQVTSINANSNAQGKLQVGDILLGYTVDYKSQNMADIIVPVSINHVYTIPDIILTISSEDKIVISVLRGEETINVEISIK